ncbi:MAG: ATP-binding cassette domain-containing protein [Oscillospiraceae bacterium]
MLKLQNIVKSYKVGDNVVPALKGISIEFRKSEFVSILGPSGCGKTTLLNIIGGLDRYDDGDMSVNGVSTKMYKDADWDSYRNHSIGFVFQNYNLIPHQTVLSNVELALTISGISKHERKKRAVEALEKVGLGDQINKKPTQMSGGQMQRVAIARALVNNPEILLADEPTGALDSETSVQIMEILKEVAKDRLVIMVTHNPELAEKYSTRIVRVLDGSLLSDSNPYAGEASSEKPDKQANKAKKTSMSYLTALSLSLNNLMTKKGRTFMTSFAGSIGIIGIALILALSTGIQAYIDDVQEDTLSSYPITIMEESVDLTSMMSSLMGTSEVETPHELDAVYSDAVMYDMFEAMFSTEIDHNNLKAFKKFIEDENSDISKYISTVQYGYDVDLNIYSGNTKDDGVKQINPSSIMADMQTAVYGSSAAEGSLYSQMYSNSAPDIWQEMLPGTDGSLISNLIKEQYDIVAGAWPESYDEVVIVLDENNEINDVFLYALGLKDSSEISEIMKSAMDGKLTEKESESWSYDEIMSTSYKLILPTDYYQYDSESGIWKDMHENESYMKYVVDNGLELKISGIIRPSEDAVSTSITGAVGYTSALTEYVINKTNESEIVKKQQEDEKTDIFTALPFKIDSDETIPDAKKASDITKYFYTLTSSEKAEIYMQIMSTPSDEEIASLTEQYKSSYPNTQAMLDDMIQKYSAEAEIDVDSAKKYFENMSEEEINAAVDEMLREAIKQNYADKVQATVGAMTNDQLAAAFDAALPTYGEAELAKLYDEYMPAVVSESTLDENLAKLGVADLSSPSQINIYAATFEAKDSINDIIEDYNKSVDEADKISYTDYVAIMMSSISTIIAAISYVLIAFVAISLVVSSIMIGIITYISVLERTKEIGILRAIGTSKKDVSRVFNAETLIVGFTSGAIGIIVTLILIIPINAIIKAITGIPNLGAFLPPAAAVILVLISMSLTLIAGLFPSKVAAKKDPVIALRSE